MPYAFGSNRRATDDSRCDRSSTCRRKRIGRAWFRSRSRPSRSRRQTYSSSAATASSSITRRAVASGSRSMIAGLRRATRWRSATPSTPRNTLVAVSSGPPERIRTRLAGASLVIDHSSNHEVGRREAATHVPFDHEAQPAEHLLLRDVPAIGERNANPVREWLVVAHRDGELLFAPADDEARAPPACACSSTWRFSPTKKPLMPESHFLRTMSASITLPKGPNLSSYSIR